MNRQDEYGYDSPYKALKHEYKYALSTNLPCVSRHSQLLALLCIFPELISLQSSSAVSSSVCRHLRSFRLAKRSASSFFFRCLPDSIFLDLKSTFYLIFTTIKCCESSQNFLQKYKILECKKLTKVKYLLTVE